MCFHKNKYREEYIRLNQLSLEKWIDDDDYDIKDKI